MVQDWREGAHFDLDSEFVAAEIRQRVEEARSRLRDSISPDMTHHNEGVIHGLRLIAGDVADGVGHHADAPRKAFLDRCGLSDAAVRPDLSIDAKDWWNHGNPLRNGEE